MRDLVVQMTRAARRALARKWFLIGFRLSGVRLNGETCDITQHPAVESLLDAEFERVYDG